MIAHVPVRAQLFEYPGSPQPASNDQPLRATLSHSQQDWPGRRTLSVVLGGCNLKCPYCFDPEHVSAHGACRTVDDLVSEVVARGARLDGLVVTGGEPTAAASLMRLLEGLSATRLPVKLDTNGAAPDVLAAALAGGLVSYVALDVKTTPERYDRLTGGSEVWERVEHSIAAILASGIDHEFKTTCYPFGVSAADLPSMAARLAGGRRYILQQFVARRTLDPGAASARPWAADELRRAALCCAVHIPTVVRGV